MLSMKNRMICFQPFRTRLHCSGWIHRTGAIVISTTHTAILQQKTIIHGIG
jgi:hypothetical protein